MIATSRTSSSAWRRALPDSICSRSRISSWRARTRSWKRTRTWRRCAKLVCAHAPWAPRARSIAAATSSGVQRGTTPSGAPVNACSISTSWRGAVVWTRAARASIRAGVKRREGRAAAARGGASGTVAMGGKLPARTRAASYDRAARLGDGAQVAPPKPPGPQVRAARRGRLAEHLRRADGPHDPGCVRPAARVAGLAEHPAARPETVAAPRAVRATVAAHAYRLVPGEGAGRLVHLVERRAVAEHRQVQAGDRAGAGVARHAQGVLDHGPARGRPGDGALDVGQVLGDDRAQRVFRRQRLDAAGRGRRGCSLAAAATAPAELRRGVAPAGGHDRQGCDHGGAEPAAPSPGAVGRRLRPVAPG